LVFCVPFVAYIVVFKGIDSQTGLVG